MADTTQAHSTRPGLSTTAILVAVGCAVFAQLFFEIVTRSKLGAYINWHTATYILFILFNLCISGCIIAFFWVQDAFRRMKKEHVQQQSDYVATAAHELRTPLTSIRWGLADLRADASLSPDTRSVINGLYDHVRGLIDQIGTFMLIAAVDHDARAQDLKVINLSPIILDTLTRAQFVAVSRKIQIKRDASLNTSIQVKGDPLRLRLVFDNLISNAIKYSRENTTVTVGYIDQGAMKTFFVSDQGIGIPEADISKIFVGFQRATNAKRPGILGTGFGLYTVKKIIDFHGGTITCKSEINKGTTFYVSLPSL